MSRRGDDVPEDGHEPTPFVEEDWDAREAAVSRLEEHLHTLPYDRALPDLDTLLHDAQVERDLLRREERARKVLHEAILARPLADVDTVAMRATEVELLVLEVQVLTQTLRDAAGRTLDTATKDAAGRAAARLTWIRGRLEELRRVL